MRAALPQRGDRRWRVPAAVDALRGGSGSGTGPVAGPCGRPAEGSCVRHIRRPAPGRQAAGAGMQTHAGSPAASDVESPRGDDPLIPAIRSPARAGRRARRHARAVVAGRCGQLFASEKPRLCRRASSVRRVTIRTARVRSGFRSAVARRAGRTHSRQTRRGVPDGWIASLTMRRSGLITGASHQRADARRPLAVTVPSTPVVELALDPQPGLGNAATARWIAARSARSSRVLARNLRRRGT